MKNNNTYIFALTLVATLGGLLFGYDTAVISGTVESLRKFFIEPQGLPLDQANALEGFVVSSALIGCILGASFAGWISQRYGRKPTLILAAILFLLSAIGSAWPELFIGMPGSGDHTFMYAFVAYRILGGIGVGLASMVSPMYIAEVAPADRRGESGGMEPVCHYLWYAGGIFRELYDRPSRRCRLAEYDRLALDVRFRDYSGGIVPLVLDVRAGDASLPRDAWAYGEGVGRLESFDGSGGRWP